MERQQQRVNGTGIIFLVIIAIVIAVVVLLLLGRRRSAALRQKFGSEYRRAVGEFGDERKAEAELVAREKRVRGLNIRALTPEEQERFAEAWKRAQARFVDEPSQAAADADILVKELMQTRGYPVGDFEQRAADISVDHSEVVSNYRAAREIALRNNAGKATTEDIRQAMVHYRSLFEELLETTEPVMQTEKVG
jgi:Sec-independent protein translocase protein TatA